MTDRKTACLINSVLDFEIYLRELTGLDAELSPQVSDSVSSLLAQAGPATATDREEVEKYFYGRINRKLAANRSEVSKLFAGCAAQGYTFNYAEKKRITTAIDEEDLVALKRELTAAGLPTSTASTAVANCQPASRSQSIRLLARETEKPSRLRKALKRDVAEDVFNSCAGPLVFALWPRKTLYSVFGGGGDGDSAHDYLDLLLGTNPELFIRDRTLSVNYYRPASSRSKVREDVCGWIDHEYDMLTNHGFIGLVVDAERNPAFAWAAVHDALIFGERVQKQEVKQLFFRRDQVARETTGYIPGLDAKACEFNFLYEGFTYRDIFILHDSNGRPVRLVLIMQKNKRDETRIPCPECRSVQVEGNSYPTFGVRSWECRNPLCRGRSVYNRGFRFQFKSVVQQAALEDPQNEISSESVRRWQRDVLEFQGDHEILDTLVRHYSLSGDSIHGVNLPTKSRLLHGRRLYELPTSQRSSTSFWQGSFFDRFLPAVEDEPGKEPAMKMLDEPWQVICGDSRVVLSGFPDDYFDRAVTSPPYFNAREYATWPNLYCYLYDMWRNTKQVFRTLKPGSFYVYNIFDYFDNERIVTFSEMGKKRIPLGALMSEIFERCGFEIAAVVPWDKGEIQGKRGFNGGNFSPYYQSPFNCWEHVIIARKPVIDEPTAAPPLPANWGRVARIKPVFKMVRGKNVLGHTAPFPEELVELFLDGLSSGSVVVDPYGGSGTTGRAALRHGIKSLQIERERAYAELASRRMIEVKNELDSILF